MRYIFVILVGLLLISCTIKEATKAPELNTIIGSSVAIGVIPHHEYPDRKYHDISATALYDFILRTLKENDFKLERSDRSTGLIRAKLEKGAVRKFNFDWKKKYRAHYEIKTELENEEIVFVYSYLWVEKKTPLGVPKPTKDEYCEQIRDAILLRIDQYVQNNGGKL
uniref:Uncharacterized protein n=1 Tax=Candidatus Kentrum sp. LFY TaxID=2126342 RepID=A0A450WV88_9GAMM|nr:MAG: hypothetical protein BECKLFY1418C_GA0070996_108010 [Candidatus Kentron sp. LFY]